MTSAVFGLVRNLFFDIFTWLAILCCHLVCGGGEMESHASLKQAKRDLKMGKNMPPNDVWNLGYLKFWDQWIDQSFQGHCSWTPQGGLQRSIWTPKCNGQCADAHWVLACNLKTQFFTKNGGQQKCLDKALWLLV